MSLVQLPKKSTRVRNRDFSEPNSITGRDAYIVAKALVYAIETIEGLPERRQEGSDCQAMKAIFETLFNPSVRKAITGGVCLHLRQEDGRDLRTA
jgi:hypothetical protein